MIAMGRDGMGTKTAGGEDSGKPGRRRACVVNVRPAGDAHQVVTVVGGQGVYRRKPCKDCPWRKDAVGEFPAEAFRHSANTAYDMSQHTFACHQMGAKKPGICAGFLLKGSDHNLAVRLKRMQGLIGDDVQDGGHELFENYRAMAVANGVAADEDVLQPCRD
jgi:hypothetical protein